MCGRPLRNPSLDHYTRILLYNNQENCKAVYGRVTRRRYTGVSKAGLRSM